MGLKHGDLKNTMLSKVSVDEFEPKTGNAPDVIVIAFSVLEKEVGEDLYGFINSGVRQVRDVEISPNPDLDGYYIVFVEIDRTEYALDDIRALIADVGNLTGPMRWKIRTHLTDRFWNLDQEEVEEYIITNPENYMSREEFQQREQEEEELRAIQQSERETTHEGYRVLPWKIDRERYQERDGLEGPFMANGGRVVYYDPKAGKYYDPDTDFYIPDDEADKLFDRHGIEESAVYDFFSHSDLESVTVQENRAALARRGVQVNLELIAYGDASTVMEQLGLTHLPLQEGDSQMRKFRQMLGSQSVYQVGDHMVIQSGHTSDILVVKPC